MNHLDGYINWYRKELPKLKSSFEKRQQEIEKEREEKRGNEIFPFYEEILVEAEDNHERDYKAQDLINKLRIERFDDKSDDMYGVRRGD